MRRNIKLADVPKSLLASAGIERRVPERGAIADHTGKEFPSSTVVGLAGISRGNSYWLCRCKCGKLFLIKSQRLCASQSRALSCGCVYHGLCKTQEHNAWCSLRSRHRGQVSDKWDSFREFLSDMGKSSKGRRALVRIDNTKPYGPGNCRWGTKAEAVRASSNPLFRPLTHNGMTMLLAEWARQIGITKEAMRLRVNDCVRYGIDISEAITTPPREPMPSKALKAKLPTPAQIVRAMRG